MVWVRAYSVGEDEEVGQQVIRHVYVAVVLVFLERILNLRNDSSFRLKNANS